MATNAARQQRWRDRRSAELHRLRARVAALEQAAATPPTPTTWVSPTPCYYCGRTPRRLVRMEACAACGKALATLADAPPH